MSVREKDDPALYAKIQEQNLLRQYDLLSNCIEIGLKKGIEFFDKYTLWALNYAAVSNISQFGGRFREEPIYVGNHFPPHFKEVSNQMDRFFSVVHENWAILDHPTIHRGQRKNREGCLLLSDLFEAGPTAAGKENRTGANQGKPGALLCGATSGRQSVGRRALRCIRVSRLSCRAAKGTTQRGWLRHPCCSPSQADVHRKC